MEPTDCRLWRWRMPWRPLLAMVLMSGVAGTALAHHTYSMHDITKRVTVSGTVAKFEWTNPHAYIWVYVPSSQTPGKYDLYAFENGAPTLLSKQGWSRASLQANDKVTIEFAPLRDGKPGGHCMKVTKADGHVLICPGPGAVQRPEVNQ
jgi:hypothetical protein